MAMSGAQGLSQERPFPGLRPFAFADHDYFFGRKAQFYALYRLIDVNHFVAVVGSSGSGKSSLVRAGLLPLLQQENDESGARTWLWQEMRPGAGPIERLGEALISLARTVSKDDDPVISAAREERIKHHLRESSFGVEDALSEIETHDRVSFVLVVDQFEELFRFAIKASQGLGEQHERRTRNEATRFVQLLLAAARSKNHDVRVIITMRSDFIGDCARFQGLPEAVSAAQFLVPALTRDQREQVIRGPIRAANATIEPTLVERILIESNEEFDQLPVMAHCLRRLWDRAGSTADRGTASTEGTQGIQAAASADHQPEPNPAGARHITQEHYKDIGGIEHALSLHANELLRDLPGLMLVVEQTFRALSELDKEGRATQRARLFEQLLAETGAPENDLRKVLDRFRAEDCSFLTPPLSTVPHLTPDTRLDVGHEALLRRWELVSGEPGATGEENDPRRLGWLREEASDGQRYQALLSLIGSASIATLPLDQVEKHTKWWTSRPRTKAWAERYGGDRDRIQRLMDDSRAALEADEKRRKAEAEREQQSLALERRAFRMSRLAAVVSTALLVIVGAFSLKMYWQSKQIDEQYEEIKNSAEEIKKNAAEAERNRDIGINQTRKLALAVLDALNLGAVSPIAAQEILTSAEAALSELARAMQTPKVKSVRAQLYISTSDVYASLGIRTEALRRASEASALGKQLLEAGDVEDGNQVLYDSFLRIGDVELKYRNNPVRLASALENYLEAKKIAVEMDKAKPKDGSRLYNLVFIDIRIAEALQLQAKFTEALGVLNEALEFSNRCAAMYEAKGEWRISPAITLTKIGVAMAEQQALNDEALMAQRKNALAKLDEAIKLHVKMQDELRTSSRNIITTIKSHLARAYIVKANVLASLGQYERAAEEPAANNQGEFSYFNYVTAIVILRKLIDDDPGNVNALIDLATAYEQYGTILQKNNKLKEALEQFELEVAIRRKLVERNDNYTDWIRQKLTEQTDTNADWKNALVESQDRRADLITKATVPERHERENLQQDLEKVPH